MFIGEKTPDFLANLESGQKGVKEKRGSGP
jgi:hypothetical protein